MRSNEMTSERYTEPVDTLREESALIDSLQPYRYAWPASPLAQDTNWVLDAERRSYVRQMPESPEALAKDSRWPAMFPAPICIITTTDGRRVAMEREVGASIVNRFPYVVALSFCRKALSSRHHARHTFSDILEKGEVAALQFLPPGPKLDAVMEATTAVPDAQCEQRIARTGLSTRPGTTNAAPVFNDAYMVYEARLARPQKDFEGNPIYQTPWVDVGSHRIYFLEINAIQLRMDIAQGKSQVRWRALPAWRPSQVSSAAAARAGSANGRYQKGYNPNYSFPSPNTVAFDFDDVQHGMAIKHLPPLPEDQVEVDNDRARWPCFFPSSCGLITTWTADGTPNVMPCGSTTVVSRYPLVISPCVSNAKINERYATRKSLEIIRRSGKFGCGVPYVGEEIIEALKYAGNNSLAQDLQKVAKSGFTTEPSEYGPVLSQVPVHFDCEVTGEVRLGTHIMFFGEVRRIRVRTDVTPDNPLEWCPWAGIAPSPVA